MSGLFQNINGNVTEEQVNEIARTGVVPSHLKTAEDKLYYVICRNYKYILTADIFEAEIDGEALIGVGRHDVFVKIKDYLYNDVDMTTDLEKSLVMVEGVDAAKAISLYRFIKLCNSEYPDEALDNIDEFIEAKRDWEARTEGNYNEKPNASATGFGGNAGTIMNEEE